MYKYCSYRYYHCYYWCYRNWFGKWITWGVTASWSSNTITISGTPNASGTFSYTIPLTGGCGTVDATGTITVNDLPTVDAGTDQTVCSGDNVTLSGSGASTYTWDNGVTNNTAFTASTTTTYTVTGTDANGCQNTDQVTVTITPDNTAGAASSNPTVCINTALTDITIATTGATGIGSASGLPSGVTASWSSNTITISGTPNASGTFSYTIPLTGGCGTVDATGTITVNDLPTVDAGTDQTVCSGDNVTLSGSGASTYTWDNGVTNNTAFTASTTTTYTVTGTDANGCQNTDQVTVTITPDNTAGAASSNPTVCINTALTDITIATTGATGIGSASGFLGSYS